MKFFLSMIPPTATAQEHRVKMINGRPVFFDPPRVKEAKANLTNHLKEYKPRNPLEGPLSLTTIWHFPTGKSHEDGEWRTTRPDTDNLVKLLKDCMTKTGFWLDDAQVVREEVSKLYSENLVGISIQIDQLNNNSLTRQNAQNDKKTLVSDNKKRRE